MRQWNLAIVGCGGVSRLHLDSYRAHPERLRLVAACDPEEGRAAQRGDEYGIERAFTSLDAMIQEAEWEVAAVCTPTPVREKVVQTLAAAGKHIFVEKPLADSYEEARRMVAVCRDAEVQLAVDQNFRHHYPFELARNLIAEGRIGKVIGVLHQDLMFRQDAGWRVECPRHALSVMGVHWLDGFRWMLGSEAASVTAVTSSSPAIRCKGETDAFLQIAFASGAAVSYVESFSSPISRTETLVMGEAGCLVLDYAGAALYAPERRGEAKERWSILCAGANKPEATFLCLNELLTSLEEGRRPSNSGEDNLNTIALLDAAYRSAERGETVRLGSTV